MPWCPGDYGTVIVEIVPDRHGCLMALTHGCLPWGAVSGAEQGWTGMLGGLTTILESEQ